jgi:hypothetical protein
LVNRFRSVAVSSSALAACVAGLAGGVPAAGAASTLPTLNIALAGKTGISVSGSQVSGAVNVVSTFSGKGGPGAFALVRLNPNLPPQTAATEGSQAVQSHHGDLDALTATGSLLIASAQPPGTIQTVLQPGAYLALNVTGMGRPGIAMFNVTKSASPASLPAAAATQTAIEFGFSGPTTLHAGTIVRGQNSGFLVHMIDLLGVKSKADGQVALAGL